MNEHAGKGCILSVLIIVAFTVIFHEADRPAAPPRVVAGPSHPQPTVAPHPESLAASPPPAPIPPGNHPTVVAGPGLPTSSRPNPAVAAPPAAQPSIVAASTVTLIGLSRPVATEVGPAPSGRFAPGPPVAAGPPPPPITEPRRPASSATIIREGERLADVAVRVYGTPDAAGRLWQANRDRLRGVDAPVAAGLLIRTP